MAGIKAIKWITKNKKKEEKVKAPREDILRMLEQSREIYEKTISALIAAE